MIYRKDYTHSERDDYYATIKARGVGVDKTYILTVMKQRVKQPGGSKGTNPDDYDANGNYIGDIPFVSREEVNRDGKDTFNYELGRFEESLTRTRSRIIELGFNNDWKYFVTITLDAEKIGSLGLSRYDLKGVYQYLSRAFNNYKNRLSTDFRYLIIPELHKDGAIHFHGMMMGLLHDDLFINDNGYLDSRYFNKRFGYVTLDKVRSREATAAYITKYITKSMFSGFVGDDRFEFHKQFYRCSKGLSRDEVKSVGETGLTADECEKSGHEVVCDNAYCFKAIIMDEETALQLVRPIHVSPPIENYDDEWWIKTPKPDPSKVSRDDMNLMLNIGRKTPDSITTASGNYTGSEWLERQRRIAGSIENTPF